jgi:type II secretory pathway pseudopilin PulG
MPPRFQSTLMTFCLAPNTHHGFLRNPLRHFRQTGAVLLEVILALALFVTAATIITSGLNASLAGVERLRSNTHAANLAVSVLSELQLGIKSLNADGPQPFEPPWADWTWEVITLTELGSDQSHRFKSVEVVIRRLEPAFTHRLFQIIPIEAASSSDSGSPDALSP